MRTDLVDYIKAPHFPCIMAKALCKKGTLKIENVNECDDEKTILNILMSFYKFIENFRTSSSTLHSFVLIIENNSYSDFQYFEFKFWNFLEKLYKEDKQHFNHDCRVNKDPLSKHFSYSIMEESFFIVALHPQSPRWSRRFTHPAIVFNPHQQFEDLRKSGRFKKIRDAIRKKDFLLQGSINPMLNDFGESSEVFQYLGKEYSSMNKSPLKI